jgi:DNA-binding NarL/FixJ family response regulator
MKKYRILLVDDHPKFLKAFQFMIEDAFPDRISFIEFAHNGEECLQKLEEKIFDIVFMDIDMPVMNGISATQQINELYRGVKVIALSLHSDMKYVIQMMEAGARNYLVKEEIDKEKLELAMNG